MAPGISTENCNSISFGEGAFNVKLDTENNYKPRCSTCTKDMMGELNLEDTGGDNNVPSWRRPHLPKSQSRLD
jgi:hypothetical protein